MAESIHHVRHHERGGFPSSVSVLGIPGFAVRPDGPLRLTIAAKRRCLIDGHSGDPEFYHLLMVEVPDRAEASAMARMRVFERRSSVLGQLAPNHAIHLLKHSAGVWLSFPDLPVGR